MHNLRFVNLQRYDMYDIPSSRGLQAASYERMSHSTPPPNRTRSLSNLSSVSGSSVSSPLARRPRPSPLHLSPGSSYTSTPASYSYASSVQSGSATPASARYQSFSTAPSNVGSVMTTTTPGGPAKFRKGHARKKAPVIPATANPDELDLNTLTDPDDLFRLFGVRDVRGLEKRARYVQGNIRQRGLY